MTRGFYRLVTGLLEPLAAPFVGRDRREPLPPLDGGVWFHAASAGEVRGLVTLARRLGATGPRLLTAQTIAGVQAAHRLLPELAARRARFDFPRAARRAVAEARPALHVVAETELWPNHLDAFDVAGVPRVLVNARISDRTIGRYRRMLSLTRPLLGGFRLVAAQSERDAERLQELGARVETLCVTGSMKHDLPPADVAPARLAWLDAPLVVLGSVRPGESRLLAEALAPLLAARPELRVVVAPRHPAVRREVATAFGAIGYPPEWRSAGAPRGHERVLGLDTMGELAGVYARARVAFVGGTLRPFGGHNVLEPALLGVPVVHGPFTANCRLEADALAATGGAVMAADPPALRQAFLACLEDDTARAVAGAAAREAVARLSGATARVLAALGRAGLVTADGLVRGAGR